MPRRHLPRRDYADGPHGQGHFLDTRKGAPVVLLHQASLNAHQFDAVFAPLAARGLRAIANDLPGFVPAIADYAGVVPVVLDRLGLASADLLGHHTGALVATEVALAPSRSDSPADPQRPTAARGGGARQLHAQREGTGKRIYGSARRHAPRRGLCGTSGHSAGAVLLERVQDYILWMFGSPGPFWYGHYTAFAYDHAPRMIEIRHPTLILTNTGDAIFEHACRTRVLRPDWAFVALGGGGIDIQDQAPGAWASAVAGFFTNDSESR